MPGANWTIAGITASQCGVPLKAVSVVTEGNQIGERIGTFLPSARCLSDILNDQGYTTVFMGGAALTFSGKNRFFATHHYDEAWGANEWGLHDQFLIHHVVKKIDSLIEKKTPFMMSALTLGTHSRGYPGPDCGLKDPSRFEDVVECASNQIGDLLDHAKKHHWLDQMNIVILGDHFAMENPLRGKLIAQGKGRSIFNAFISKIPLKKATDRITHFDLFPTLLEFSGISIRGAKLGLGTSAISKESNFQKGRRKEMEQNVMNYSKAYEDLWRSKN